MTRPNDLYLLVLVLFLSACMPPRTQQMYSGPPLPADKESTITTNGPMGPRPGLRISSVDEDKTINFFQRWFTGPATEVKVTPGKHDIRILFNTGSWIKSRDLWLVACPGKIYVAKAIYQENGPEMWIEDQASGNRVGGVKGSPDEPKDKNVSCESGIK